MRKHGFQYPADSHQVIAVLLFSILVAGFFLFSSWQLHTFAARVGVTAGFGAATLFTLFLGVLTARIDAGDPGIRQQNHTAELTVVNQQPKYICTICKVVVQPRSKHCRKCDKCVQDFDHHCIWLNNCIGKANYGSFMCLLTATLGLLLFQAAVNAVLLATSFTQPAAARNRQHFQFAGGISLTGYRIAWIVFLAAPLLLALLVGELLVFHLVLQWRGMSTYDYILAQREKHASQRLPPKVSPDDGPPSNSLISANASSLDPDGYDMEADQQEAPRGRHHRIRLSPCAALSVPEEDASSRASAKGLQLSRPESVVSMNSLLVAGTNSEQGGRISDRGMRRSRSRQEGGLSSRPTTGGGDVSQSQELTKSWDLPPVAMRRSRQDVRLGSRPTTSEEGLTQSQELKSSWDSPSAGMHRGREDGVPSSSRRPNSGNEISQSQELAATRSQTPSAMQRSRPDLGLSDEPAGEDLAQSQELIPAGMSVDSSAEGLSGRLQLQQQSESAGSLRSPKSVMQSVKGSIGLQPSNRVRPFP